MINLARNLLALNSFEEIAKHSAKNHHAVGFDCYCLHRSNELTIKLYHLTAEIKANAQGYIVNPHSHLYSFDTYVLRGCVRHWRFRKTLENNWNEFTYNVDQKQFICFGKTGLEIDDVDIHSRDSSYFVDSNEYHTIEACSPETVLLIMQYKDVSDSSKYFSMDENEPDLTGLYQPITREDIARIKKVIEL